MSAANPTGQTKPSLNSISPINMKSLKKVAVLLLLALAANAALGAATTYNWNNNAGGNWSATANWSPSTGDPLRDNLDTAIFGNNGGLLSGPSIAVTNDADLQGGVAVYFTNNINYTINPNGYKIKFSSSTTSPIIMSSGTGTNTINSPVVLYGSSLFGITNNSAGLLTLNQIQTAVSVAHPTNVFLFGGTGNILWASNVITAGGNVCTNSLTMGGSGTLTLAADPTTNLNNGITVSAGTLVMKGQTNVTVTSSHTGGTTINSGAVLELGDGTAGGGFGDPGTSGLTNNGTIIVSPGYAVSSAFARTLTNNGNILFYWPNVAVNCDFATVINGSGTVTKDGPGRAWLKGVSTYTGNTTNGGTGYLDISADSGLGASIGMVVFPVGGASELRSRGSFATSRNVLLNGNAIIGALSGSTFTFNGPISGVGNLTIGDVNATGGTVVLAGTDTYSGKTTILYGTLALSGSALITNTAGIVVASNAIFNVSGLTSAFTLAQSLSSQTLSNSAPGAIINGTNNCSAGTMSLVYDGVNPSFIQTNGGMTLSSSTTFKVNNTGSALAVGSYLVISNASAGTVGLVAGTAPSAVTMTGTGISPGCTASLQIGSTGLNLVVATNSSITTIAANDPNIQYVGRFDQTTPTAPAFDWSHSCISAKFQGTSCSVILGGISKYFDVYLDGTNTGTILSSNNGVETLLAASGLTNGVHSISIYRRDEASKGLNTFQGFVLDSGKALIAPAARPSRRMEFIGDSFTCGYGVLTTYGNSFSYATEDAGLSFAGLMANHYNADCMVTAWSGEGMVKNINDTNQTSATPLPYYYPRTCGSVTTNNYSFTWQPNVVVIVLGLNDFHTPPPPLQGQYVSGYSNFVKTVRGHYLNADIVCTYLSQMDISASNYIQTVVSTSGDSKVHFVSVSYTLINPTDLGADAHPNVSGQIKIANAFISAFDGSMGTSWGSVPPPLISRPAVNSSGPLTFNYSTTSGATYHVETTTNLSPASWATVPGSTTNAVGTSVAFTDTTPASSHEHFYRIVSP